MLKRECSLCYSAVEKYHRAELLQQLLQAWVAHPAGGCGLTVPTWNYTGLWHRDADIRTNMSYLVRTRSIVLVCFYDEVSVITRTNCRFMCLVRGEKSRQPGIATDREH